MMAETTVALKARGALLAAAVGDAMGWPQEDRSHRVRDAGNADRTPGPAFREWKRRVGSRFQPVEETVNRGEYSDDTQLLLATCRALLSGPEWCENLARVELPTWLLYERGGGRATKNAAEAWLFGREPWKQSKLERRNSYFNAGGNGAAMRVLPHAVWGASHGNFDSVASSALADGILTHGHPRALIGALSYAYAAWWTSRHSGTLSYGALVEAVLSSVESWSKLPTVGDPVSSWAESALGDSNRAYERAWADTVVEMIQLLRTAREGVTQGSLAVDRRVMTELGCFSAAVKGAGTIAAAAAVFLASRYASDPMKGVTEAAFATGADTDTLASMTGGLLGLLCGEEWLDGQGRDIQDAGQIRELADLLAVGEVASHIAERYRRARPVTPAKAKGTMAALGRAHQGGTVCLPDERTARVVSRTELVAGLNRHVGFLWRLSVSDGQTVYVRRLQPAKAPLRPSASPDSSESANSPVVEEHDAPVEAHSATEKRDIEDSGASNARLSTVLPDVESSSRNLKLDSSRDAGNAPPQLTIPLECNSIAEPPIEIKVHAEALRRFSERAEKVRASLGPALPTPPSPPVGGSRAHVPVIRSITLGADTLDSAWIEGAVDPRTGRYVHLEIHSQQFHLALSPSGMQAFSRLADLVARHKDLREECTVAYVESCLINWLKQAQLPNATRLWGDVLVECLRRDVGRHRILVPLEGIAIAEEFSIGAVRFGFFTREYFDRLYSRVQSRGATEDTLAAIRQRFTSYQGIVHASFECVAEPERATERALNEVERVLSLLRFFHPAALDIRAHCPLGRMGGLTPHLAHFFVERGGELVASSDQERRRGMDFDLSRAEFRELMGDGLAKVDQLLRATESTELERRVLDAMAMFSSGLLSPEIEHRLIHALVAVESLLLKNATEPIMGSLATRVARVAAHTIEERRQIVTDLRRVYDIRSSFVHHGVQADPANIDLINRAIMHCWAAVLELLREPRWSTKEELIQALDDRLLA